MKLGMFETPISFKRVIRCRRCGYNGLYWNDRVLSHWAVPEAGGKARFVPHRCGFDSWGRRKAPIPTTGDSNHG